MESHAHETREVAPLVVPSVSQKYRVVIDCNSAEDAANVAQKVVQFRQCCTQQCLVVSSADNKPISQPLVLMQTNYTLKQ